MSFVYSPDPPIGFGSSQSSNQMNTFFAQIKAGLNNHAAGTQYQHLSGAILANDLASHPLTTVRASVGSTQWVENDMWRHAWNELVDGDQTPGNFASKVVPVTLATLSTYFVGGTAATSAPTALALFQRDALGGGSVRALSIGMNATSPYGLSMVGFSGNNNLLLSITGATSGVGLTMNSQTGAVTIAAAFTATGATALPAAATAGGKVVAVVDGTGATGTWSITAAAANAVNLGTATLTGLLPLANVPMLSLGYISDFVLTASASVNWTISVGAGNWVDINGQPQSISATLVALTAPPAGGSGLFRWDALSLQPGGGIRTTTGTPLASPVKPGITSGDVPLGYIFRRPGDTLIAQADVYNFRSWGAIVNATSSGGIPTTINVVTATDQSGSLAASKSLSFMFNNGQATAWPSNPLAGIRPEISGSSVDDVLAGTATGNLYGSLAASGATIILNLVAGPVTIYAGGKARTITSGLTSQTGSAGTNGVGVGSGVAGTVWGIYLDSGVAAPLFALTLLAPGVSPGNSNLIHVADALWNGTGFVTSSIHYTSAPTYTGANIRLDTGIGFGSGVAAPAVAANTSSTPYAAMPGMPTLSYSSTVAFKGRVYLRALFTQSTTPAQQIYYGLMVNGQTFGGNSGALLDLAVSAQRYDAVEVMLDGPYQLAAGTYTLGAYLYVASIAGTPVNTINQMIRYQFHAA
jgi:hypothetical protein